MEQNSNILHDESKDLSTIDLLNMKLKLDDELEKATIAHLVVDQEIEPYDSVEQLRQRVSDLKVQLFKESNERSKNELFIKRVEMGKTLCDILFEGHDKANAEFVNWSMEELELISQMMVILKETSALQEKYDTQIVTNTKLKRDNTDMMKKLRDNSKIQEISAAVSGNSEYKRLQSELKTKCMALAINKNLVQLMLMGTEADITHDSHLRELLMKCGEAHNL